MTGPPLRAIGDPAGTVDRLRQVGAVVVRQPRGLCLATVLQVRWELPIGGAAAPERRDLLFGLADNPNSTAEFIAEGRRKATELVIWPTGRFVRESRASGQRA